MPWCIYKHTNKINGKVYIGQTCQKPEERWRNGEGYFGQGLFYNAIKKYGWDNFQHDILEDNILTLEETNEKEKYYIKQFHSCVYDPLCNGYNLTWGGEGTSKWSEEEDEILFCYYPIEGTDCYIRFDGRFSREAVRSRANSLGIYCQFTTVLRLDDNWQIEKEYGKITEVEEDGYSRGAVLSCCERKQTKSGNKYWCYKKDYSEDWEPWFGKFIRNEAVYCVELDKEFENVKLASETTGANYSHIRHCCYGLPRYNTAGGYHWCWLKDKNSFVKRYDKDTSQCYCINDGRFFETLALAGKYYGCSSSDISSVCRGVQKTTHGLTFCYAKDYNTALKPNKPKNKLVRCIETGVVYSSLTEAEKNSICSRSCISTSCRTGKPTKGYHWEYVEEDA